MRGLRTQENAKFNVFFGLVQKTAQKINSIFFMDCGEGRDFETPDMEGEDMSGWLIPKEQANVFEKEFLDNNVSDEWSDFISFAIWEKAGDKVSVKFKQF